jgi:hypothetical protein
MSNRAIILGCSHAFGAEMDKDPGLDLEDGWDKWYFGVRNSYPVLIAEALELTPQNHAISGGSNDAMFRIFESLLPTLVSTDVVIACWTGGLRTEIWNDVAQQWLPFQVGYNKFHKSIPDKYMLEGLWIPDSIAEEAQYLEYQKYWFTYNTDYASTRLNKIKNIVALNAMAHLHNIQVININSFDHVSPRNFKFPEYIKWPVPVSFCQWADELKSPRTENLHYFYPTHKNFADYVVAGIKNS